MNVGNKIQIIWSVKEYDARLLQVSREISQYLTSESIKETRSLESFSQQKLLNSSIFYAFYLIAI